MAPGKGGGPGRNPLRPGPPEGADLDRDCLVRGSLGRLGRAGYPATGLLPRLLATGRLPRVERLQVEAVAVTAASRQRDAWQRVRVSAAHQAAATNFCRIVLCSCQPRQHGVLHGVPLFLPAFRVRTGPAHALHGRIYLRPGRPHALDECSARNWGRITTGAVPDSRKLRRFGAALAGLRIAWDGFWGGVEMLGPRKLCVAAVNSTPSR
jgi:hypothetical protein